MNFIKTSDKETKEKLIELGFVLLSENGGVATFLNNNKNTLDFSNEMLVFTNKLEFQTKGGSD